MVSVPDPEIQRVLQELGFPEVSAVPRMKDVVKMFRKMALKRHPDKPGGSKEQFQLLQEAFLKIGSWIETQQQRGETTGEQDDLEENIAKNIFKQFYLHGVWLRSQYKHLFSDMSDAELLLMDGAELRQHLTHHRAQSAKAGEGGVPAIRYKPCYHFSKRYQRKRRKRYRENIKFQSPFTPVI